MLPLWECKWCASMIGIIGEMTTGHTHINLHKGIWGQRVHRDCLPLLIHLCTHKSDGNHCLWCLCRIYTHTPHITTTTTFSGCLPLWPRTFVGSQVWFRLLCPFPLFFPFNSRSVPQCHCVYHREASVVKKGENAQHRLTNTADQRRQEDKVVNGGEEAQNSAARSESTWTRWKVLIVHQFNYCYYHKCA